MINPFTFRIKQFTKPLLGSLLLSLTALSAQAVVFQAEDYSNYSDTTAGNTGGAYRADGVDIEGTTDSGGGYNLGWIDTSEWLVYPNLAIPSTGSYTIKLRVASPSGATASVDLNAGSIQFGDFAIPSTGGWQNWTTVTKTVNINAGTYNLGVFAKSNGWNFNWIEIIANGNTKVGPAGYSYCTDENQTCSFSGTRSVAYGANGKFNYKTATGSIACNNGTFGDPIANTLKSCYFGADTSTTGFASIVSEAQFNQMFPNRNGFYTYAGLVDAAKSFPAFAGTGDLAMKKREAAAALANFSHETSGLIHITEVAKNDYCGDWDGNPNTCPCAAGKRYYGRGPMQLSWNGNYCAAGDALGLDLRANPDLVEQNATVAWKTALWFWMTQTGAGYWTSHSDIVDGHGFGETIRTINGSLECSGGNPAQVQDRINEINRFIQILGTSAGAGNIGC
jgi:predicted chitinase